MGISLLQVKLGDQIFGEDEDLPQASRDNPNRIDVRRKNHFVERISLRYL